MKTDTPETDAAWASWTYAGPGVHANFARKLERERNESRRQHAADVAELNERLAKQQSDMLDTIVKLRRETQAMQEVISNYEHRLKYLETIKV
jgi:K+/H+ antiporter YhaU regulatory subunit KhtT